jgi:hypothetical protein
VSQKRESPRIALLFIFLNNYDGGNWNRKRFPPAWDRKKAATALAIS